MPELSSLAPPPASRLDALRQWLLAPANQLLLLLLVLAAFPLFYDLGQLPTQIWDEARLAMSARDMAHGGNALVVTYLGQPDHWSTKPPLLIWWQAISFHLFGYTSWALRLPSALAALATVIILYRFAAYRLARPLAGFFGGLVLVTAVGFVRLHGVRTGDYDGPLALFETVAWIAFFEYLEEGKARQLYWLGAAMVLAVLTKGVAGLLGGPALVVYALLTGRLWWLLRQPRLYAVAVGCLAVVAAYYLGREHYDPGYLQAVHQNELGDRYNTVVEGHSGPPGFYFNNLYNYEFSTWLWWLLPAGLVWLQPQALVRRAGLLLLLFALGWLLVLSPSATKIDWYSVPVYPPLALLVGLGLDYLYRDVLATYLPRLAPAWHWPVRVALVLLVFYFPFRSIMRDIISQRQDTDAVDNDQRLARYVRDSARGNTALGPVTLVGKGGYNATLDFYANTLTEAGLGPVSSFYIGYHRQLKPGTVVMVCDPTYRARLDSAFRLTTMAQSSPCETILLGAK